MTTGKEETIGRDEPTPHPGITAHLVPARGFQMDLNWNLLVDISIGFAMVILLTVEVLPPPKGCMSKMFEASLEAKHLFLYDSRLHRVPSALSTFLCVCTCTYG